MRRTPIVLCLFALVAGFASPAHALDPQGVFPIGPDDRALEVGPSVARDPQGNVLLAFSRVTTIGGRYSTIVQPLRLDGTFRARSRSWGPGAAAGIVYTGKRFLALTDPRNGLGTLLSQPLDALGRAVGGSETIGGVAYPNLRRNQAGGALLVGHDPARSRLLAQRFDVDGRKVGPLQTLFAEASDLADCGSDHLGRLVVAWRRGFGEIVFRRYTADLTPLGEVTPIAGTGAEALHLAVAPDGRFAIAYRDGRDHKVYVVVHRADGSRLSPAIALAAGSIYGSRDVAIEFDADGRWLVLWSHFDSDRIADSRIEARFVSGDAVTKGTTFRVAQATTYQSGLLHLGLVRTAPREFLVFWQRDIDVFVDSQIEARKLFDVPAGEDLCVAQGGALRCDLKHDGRLAEVVYSLPLDSGDRPVLFDGDGDTRRDPCVVRGGAFLCDSDRDGTLETSFPFAEEGQAMAGDLDGDGLESLCFLKGGLAHCRQLLQPSPQPDAHLSYGSAEDVPLFGDIDGDGVAELCGAGADSVHCTLFRSGAPIPVELAVRPRSGEIPFLVDINGDGSAELCGFVAGELRCHFNGLPDVVIAFGNRRAIPLVGNVDGR